MNTHCTTATNSYRECVITFLCFCLCLACSTLLDIVYKYKAPLCRVRRKHYSSHRNPCVSMGGSGGTWQALFGLAWTLIWIRPPFPSINRPAARMLTISIHGHYLQPEIFCSTSTRPRHVHTQGEASSQASDASPGAATLSWWQPSSDGVVLSCPRAYRAYGSVWEPRTGPALAELWEGKQHTLQVHNKTTHRRVAV